ncbi:unnamed protein product [Cylicocyclus nassatus]|uniref:Uncharacterized protein n=1 Tax=Cylicocyclus nassatus TaxID=53992 RepID=A0AA36GKB2_CYLNA|nr:unnamed protein product [Cylicocyclus nassatus]
MGGSIVGSDGYISCSVAVEPHSPLLFNSAIPPKKVVNMTMTDPNPSILLVPNQTLSRDCKVNLCQDKRYA